MAFISEPIRRLLLAEATNDSKRSLVLPLLKWVEGTGKKFKPIKLKEQKRMEPKNKEGGFPYIVLKKRRR